ncbi:MAG: PPOX class F420-dependent oxidoreductase [Chloroflexi bacterium]|nr:PPOX class F420-dependent oxidoreductase [Chloroflexota bacterium]
MTDGFQALATASYVSLETYRMSGAAVRTQVWITAGGGKLYCWTLTDTGKIRRIRANADVRLAKCDAGGALEGEWVAARARILDSPADLKAQLRRLRAKYGWKYLAYRLISRLRRAETTVIEFSPA